MPVRGQLRYNATMQGLSRDDILRALEMVAAELPPSKPPAELVVMGEAALVLLYGARETTRDVDALVVGPPGAASIRAVARRVAAILELPEDWLNDGAKGYVHGFTRGEVLLQTPSLIIRSLALQQLLAMKLSAWRDDVDVNDARLLLSRLPGDREGVWQLIEPYLVPGHELKARYAFDDLWETERGP